MKKILRTGTAMLVLGGVVAVGPVAADPIVVSGSFRTELVQPGFATIRYDLTGDRGFSLTALLNSNSGAFVPLLCQPCLVGPNGKLVSAAGFLSGVAGPVTLDGVTYAAGTMSFGDIWKSWVFVPSPPTADSGGMITAQGSFTWNGAVNQGVGPGRPTLVSLVGSGMATLTFAPGASGGAVQLLSARYDFQPTPEPASLLLVGTGIAAFVARRARKAARSSEA